MYSQTKRANQILIILILLFTCSVSFAKTTQHQPVDSEKVCLAKAIYYEARGEPEAGKKGVAKIVINRKTHKAFPKTICKVINQTQVVKGKRLCQFSWVCDRPKLDKSSDSWEEAQELSEQILANKVKLPNFGPDVLFFKSVHSRIRFGKGYHLVAKLGQSNFYSKKTT